MPSFIPDGIFYPSLCHYPTIRRSCAPPIRPSNLSTAGCEASTFPYHSYFVRIFCLRPAFPCHENHDTRLGRLLQAAKYARRAPRPRAGRKRLRRSLLRLRRSALRAPLPLSPTSQGGTHHDQDHPRFPLYPLWCLRQSLQPRCDQNGAERGGKAYPQGFLLFLPVLPRLPLGLPRHPAGRSLILL